MWMCLNPKLNLVVVSQVHLMIASGVQAESVETFSDQGLSLLQTGVRTVVDRC